MQDAEIKVVGQIKIYVSVGRHEKAHLYALKQTKHHEKDDISEASCAVVDNLFSPYLNAQL